MDDFRIGVVAFDVNSAVLQAEMQNDIVNSSSFFVPAGIYDHIFVCFAVKYGVGLDVAVGGLKLRVAFDDFL